MKLLIKNIKQLVQLETEPKLKVSGAAMKQIEVLENAWLAVENGIIVGFGSMNDWEGISDWRDLQVIDASGKIVLPAFVDSHTHLVYAGSREKEFVDRINGLSYEEIAARGGGILNSAKRLSETSEEELLKDALFRLNEVAKYGTGAIEIKSGYGLNTINELKILRVIKKLKSLSPITIKSTFLGAHAFPPEFKDNHKGYIDLLVNEMIPKVAEEKLADFCDVFCERNYFSIDDSAIILETAKKYGMTPKVHANQLSNSGGVQVGVKVAAISVDHLEFVDRDEITALLGSETMPTLLPGAQWFLNLPCPPARKMIDAGLPVAIASDYNPGSSPSGNMSLMMSIACVQYNMNPEEVLNAVTLNSAYAMQVSDQLGSISIGKKANLIITKNIPSYAYIPYSFGMNCVEQLLVNGELIVHPEK